MSASQSKLGLIARIVLGLAFLVFGLNGFFRFIPIPPPTKALGDLLAAFAATKFMFPMVKVLEVLCGLLLLLNRFVPLALLVLVPIVVNIVMLHAFLDPSGLPLALVLLVAGCVVAWDRRDVFRPVLCAK